GVAGGLGEYFDIDPVLIRIIFVVTALMGGSGVLAYIICWIVMPQGERMSDAASAGPSSTTAAPSADTAASAGQTPPPAEARRTNVIPGLILIFIGLLFLVDNFLPRFAVFDLWPLILVAIGAGLLWRASERS
ncbi:MAG: PspC domain-containing protein, partial [Bacteroidota bacterium]